MKLRNRALARKIQGEKVMKKILALLLAVVCCMSLCVIAVSAEETDPFEGMSVMSYSEFAAAEVDDPVFVEAYVQAAQKYSEQYGNTSLYLQDENGAYFVYRYACTAEQYAKLTVGTKVQVKGYKAEWSGEVEIVDASVTVVENADPYIAEPVDLTSVLANETELIKYQNQLATFKGLTIDKIEYKNGEPGNDIYVTVKQGDKSFDFCVESDLIAPDSAVYNKFADLAAGDLVNITGFVYWYNGVNTHITDVVGVMTYEEFVAAEIDSAVMIEAYVQAAQKYSEQYGNTTLYLQDKDGAYFVYRYACTAEEYAKLTVGTKVRVEGYKAEWAGEVEIVDATITVLSDDKYTATPVDLTSVLANEAELIKHQNQLAIFKGLTIDKIEYKNGEPGNDIYVTVKQGDKSFSFCVESDLIAPETDVYKAFATLKAGDAVDITGFVYWYNGVNTHITAVALAGDDTTDTEPATEPQTEAQTEAKTEAPAVDDGAEDDDKGCGSVVGAGVAVIAAAMVVGFVSFRKKED